MCVCVCVCMYGGVNQCNVEHASALHPSFFPTRPPPLPRSAAPGNPPARPPLQAVWGRGDVLPCRAYLRHCVLAAASLGPEAEHSFLHATYLADRCEGGDNDGCRRLWDCRSGGMSTGERGVTGGQDMPAQACQELRRHGTVAAAALRRTSVHPAS